MEAYLEVLQGPLKGTTIELKVGQPLTIGRLAECGLAIPHDPTISRRHCQIDVVPPDCLLTNLSDNGTILNGREITEAKLEHGDAIELGANTSIAFNRGRFDDEESVVRTIPIKAIEFAEQTCPSGLVRLLGTDDEMSLARVIHRLHGSSPAFAIIDFAKLGIDIPDELAEPNYLLDWLPDDVQAQNSPVVISPGETVKLDALIDEAWGNDCLILVFSKSGPDEVRGHLRSIANFNPGTGKQTPGETLFLYWWPSLLRPTLEHSAEKVVAQMMSGIDAIMIETPDQGRWCVFAGNAFLEQLQQMGFSAVTGAAD